MIRRLHAMTQSDFHDDTIPSISLSFLCDQVDGVVVRRDGVGRCDVKALSGGVANPLYTAMHPYN